MSQPVLTYLTTDSIAEGIGASQVLAYVERIAERGLDISLHTFEKARPTNDLRERLRRRHVRWEAHEFGRYGGVGGVGRVLRAARAVRGADLVHARSDLSAAAALLARSERWVWDVRSLWADQRIALGTLREGSSEHRILQRVEAGSARQSDAVLTLTEAVLPVLDARYGEVSGKSTVIPTCVDLERFAFAAMPSGPPWRLLLAGTLNTYYDVPLMVRFVHVARRQGQCELDLLAPGITAWEGLLDQVVTRREVATPDEMPERLRGCHAGLSVCRADAGVSLTASMPTKIGEFLATGRPVVVNPGLGDADRLLLGNACGIVLADTTDHGLAAAWAELEALMQDPGTPDRCRELARSHFDLDTAVDRLVAVYETL
jgi:glycosyltransferase involved in cell wall biosynthesis